MRRGRVAILLLLAGMLLFRGQAGGGEAPAPPAALSLEEAVAIALRRDPLLAAAEARVAAAEERITQSRAGLLPRLNVSEGFLRTDNPPQVFAGKLNQERFTARDFDLERLNQPHAINDFATRFTLAWPLFDGGRSWAGWRQAKQGREAAGLSLERAREQTAARTTAAYAGVLLAREELAVVDAAIAAARAHLAAAESRFDSGLSVKSDRLQAEVRLADLEQQRLQAESRLAVARAGLNAAMGLPDSERVEPTGRLEEGAALEGGVERWLETARARRRELKELALREAMAREEVVKARAGHLPTLELVGNYQLHTPDFDGAGESYDVGAVLSLELFSGLATDAKAAEARAALAEVQALRRHLESRIALEVRQAHAESASAERRIAVARLAVRQAEEALRIVSERYRGGLATIVELLTAEASLQQARAAEARARHDFTVGKTMLRLAAGEMEAM